jgi:hypothetical protein
MAPGAGQSFCALEFSDGLVPQDGRVVYWTTSLFPPALVLLYGLLSVQRWAWWATRGLAAATGLWFLAFVALIPFADLQGQIGIPHPGFAGLLPGHHTIHKNSSGTNPRAATLLGAAPGLVGPGGSSPFRTLIAPGWQRRGVRPAA